MKCESDIDMLQRMNNGKSGRLYQTSGGYCLWVWSSTLDLAFALRIWKGSMLVMVTMMVD